MPILLQECDAQYFHGNDNVYMSSNVLCTAIAERGPDRKWSGTKCSYIHYHGSFVFALSCLLLYVCVLLLSHWTNDQPQKLLWCPLDRITTIMFRMACIGRVCNSAQRYVYQSKLREVIINTSFKSNTIYHPILAIFMSMISVLMYLVEQRSHPWWCKIPSWLPYALDKHS
jgi:hypothetical protein